MNHTTVPRRAVLAALAAATAGACVLPLVAQQGSTRPAPGILSPADMTSLMPDQVFFRGQSATVQLRNAWGVRYADGALTLMALVDTSGYSTGVQQKYQLYLITEAPLKIGEGASAHELAPGAYGAGFIAGDRFIVMDVGAHDLFTAVSHRDETMPRPRPLEVVAGSGAGEYRLYDGRNFVAFRRAQ